MARRTAARDAAERAPAPTDAAPTLRSDVLRNRRVLLQAARELYATGAEVPMYEIGRRAGVGQATLYRHFPDRSSVVAAVAEELIEELEADALEIDRGPESFVILLHRVVQTVARSRGLMAVVREASAEQSQLALLSDRLLALLALPLNEAKAAGTIRDTFELDDILLVVSMVQGAIERASADLDERIRIADGALTLVLQGIFSRPDALPTSPSAGRRGKTQRNLAARTGGTTNRQAPPSRSRPSAN